MDWYDSLDSVGKLNWTGMDDLCQQYEVPFVGHMIFCDNSTKRITQMYSFLFSFLFFFFIFILSVKQKIKNSKKNIKHKKHQKTSTIYYYY